MSKPDTALPSLASQYDETNRHYSKCHTYKFLEIRGKGLSLEEGHIFLIGMEVKLAGVGIWGWELEQLNLAVRPSLFSSFLGEPLLLLSLFLSVSLTEEIPGDTSSSHWLSSRKHLFQAQ